MSLKVNAKYGNVNIRPNIINTVVKCDNIIPLACQIISIDHSSV